MKKTIIAALSTSLVLGFTASAFAIHGTMPAEKAGVVASEGVRVAIDGALRFRGRTQKDTNKDSSAREFYDGRVRLGVKAQTSDAASAYVQLETGDNNGDTWTWGQNTAGGSGNASTLNRGGTKDDNDLTLLQAWINYDPGVVGLKAGHMPLALGNNLWFDHRASGDDAIVVYADPSANTHIGLLTIKLDEGNISEGAFPTGENITARAANDIDAYVALLNQKMGAMSLGGDITLLKSSDLNLEMYNIGVRVAGKGKVSWKAEVDYQTGDAGLNIDQDAYAALAEISVDLGALKVGGLVGYGTGDDNAADTDQEQFVNFLSDVRYQSTLMGYIYAIPTLANPVTGDPMNTGLANLFLIQANASGKITDDISWKARLNYATLNETAPGQDDALGIELEGFLTWKLSAGLSYGIEAAYLIADDAYGTDPDDAYFLRHNLTLAF